MKSAASVLGLKHINGHARTGLVSSFHAAPACHRDMLWRSFESKGDALSDEAKIMAARRGVCPGDRFEQGCLSHNFWCDGDTVTVYFMLLRSPS